ncbi:LysR family transcriptional regulator [Fimbriiglobus ruber]|nr:LysR family transcriptional regulator [Fimbriiglobus ruber]
MQPPPTPLTPELCRTFVVLVRLNGSVTATARELGLNEASVSKRIRPLVRPTPPHLPRPWLEKRGKRFYLTDEGRTLLPAVTEQVERWHQFTTTAAAERTAGLTVACGQGAAGGVVLAAAAALRLRHPDAVLKVAVVRGRQRIEGIANGTYDLALVTYPPVAIHEIARCEVRVESLGDDTLVLACGIQSPWARAFAGANQPIGLEELADWPLVLPMADSAIRKQWDERVRRHAPAVPPVVAIEVGGWRVLLDYVLAGFGVGLVPRSVAALAGADVKVRPLAETLRPANRLHAVCLTSPVANELLEAFLRELISVTHVPGKTP